MILVSNLTVCLSYVGMDRHSCGGSVNIRPGLPPLSHIKGEFRDFISLETVSVIRSEVKGSRQHRERFIPVLDIAKPDRGVRETQIASHPGDVSCKC
jgi:hypothetical protein